LSTVVHSQLTAPGVAQTAISLHTLAGRLGPPTDDDSQEYVAQELVSSS
jgi:hypothetical protein